MAHETCCTEPHGDGHSEHQQNQQHGNGHAHGSKRDYLLLCTSLIIATASLVHLLFPLTAELNPLLGTFNQSVFELIIKTSWGILFGIIAVGLMDMVPRELIISMMGRGGTWNGLFRACAAGVLLDLCSHGILLVGTKLYERGASLGQVMAFLIASPWNSLSLTLILWSLIGFKWMMTFLVVSFIIGLISGFIFDRLAERGVLAKNPHTKTLPENFAFWPEAKKHWKQAQFTAKTPLRIVTVGLKGSTMVVRWIFFGIIFASAIRTFMDPAMFAGLFGPTLRGLGLTLFFATILEVCSEGSVPVAADLLIRAKAVGNSFAFLMAGIATDYTEIMALKETTRSWKIAFFLPLVTVPQVILVALLLNRIVI